MLSAQYLVNCLEKDHVCHGITTQEPRPRPMKETLHSRHHSTVLPRLGSSRMESHQNLHTHAVESAIQLQGNNRVLKKPPHPISDEEQRLNRRQRCTLSHQESLTLRVKDHSDMLSAQYLVNCLEKDHVCHGITTQEPRPRPMKETLHSRHHSTVLPRLGSSRMESHQNLHTHAVESAIQLQGNNRVLKKPPHPISDEEQRLNRRQRCTL